jgi:hypothetical protein
MKDYYDNDPIPVSALLQELEQTKIHDLIDGPERNSATKHEPKEQSSNPGPYKPWFHSRFARSRISLPRNICAADVKRIIESSPSSAIENKDLTKNRLRSNTEKQKSNTKSNRSSSSEQEDTQSENELLESQNDTWVECDECCKWRRVPQVSPIVTFFETWRESMYNNT